MRSAKLWVSIYLALIPIFACLYLITPSEFRHFTLPYESDVSFIKGNIDEEVLKRIKLHGETAPEPLPTGEWSMVASTSDDTTISYWLVFVEALDENNTDFKKLQTTLSYSCNIPLNITGNHEKVYYTMSCFEMSIKDIEQTKYSQIVDGAYRVGFGFAGEDDESFNAMINDYRLALNGNDTTYPATNRIIRMLYFSTVTHTTLGYGDIVPMNTVARSLVALQSIIGITVMGLFLNSIASRREETV